MKRTMSIMLVLAVGATIGLIGSSSLISVAAADDFPTRPITMVVAAGPGGSNDVAARLMSRFLAEELGQPVSVVNRGGGGNLLGHEYFLQQPVDGYTILRTSSFPYMTMNQLVQNASFVIEDFQPINLVDIDTSILATAADSKYGTIKELVDAIRANPGDVSMGVQPTATDMINVSLFLKALGLSVDDVRMVTFGSGGDLRTGIAGNQFDFGVVGEARMRQMGVNGLMTFSREPMTGIWDAPSVYEVLKSYGVDEYPDFLSGSIRGYFVQTELKDAYPERYARIVEAFKNISNNPEAIKAHKSQNLTTDWMGPDAAREMMLREHKALARPEYLSIVKPD